MRSVIKRLRSLAGKSLKLKDLPEHSDFEFKDVPYPYLVHYHLFREMRIAYISEGAGEPLLFLHGQGASLSTFSPIFPEIIKNYKVFALDFPGFGKSDKPEPDFSREFYIDFLFDFIQKVVKDRVWLVGHSFGGLVALLFAEERSQYLSGMTLIDPGGFYKYSRTSQKIFRQAFSMRSILSTPAEVADENFRRFTIFNITPEVEEFTGTRKRLIENKTREFWYYAKAMIANLDILFTYHFVDKHLELPIPVQIIWGDKDKMIPIRSLENARNSIPDVHIDIIGNSGHFPMLEQPGEFISRLTGFLNVNLEKTLSDLIKEKKSQER